MSVIWYNLRPLSRGGGNCKSFQICKHTLQTVGSKSNKWMERYLYLLCFFPSVNIHYFVGMLVFEDNSGARLADWFISMLSKFLHCLACEWIILKVRYPCVNTRPHSPLSSHLHFLVFLYFHISHYNASKHVIIMV